MKILEHEDWQQVPWAIFLQAHSRMGVLPSIEPINNVFAEINHGRWIVNCPNRCGGASLVSSQNPWFICVNCGSQENGGKWYNIVFPSNKVDIEGILLKRAQANRNWLKTETLIDLERENNERGVK